MRSESSFLIIVSFIAQLCGSDAYYYWQYDMEFYCGGTVTLPCGRSDYKRAGTMKYAAFVSANSSCVVNITVDSSSCGSGSSDYYNRQAIYFNVKKQEFYASSKMTIRRQSTYDPNSWFNDTTLSGYGHVSTNPTSVAQYLSQPYAANPQISLVFEGAPDYGGYMSFTLDYNVVHDTYSYGDSNCGALSGYVLNELICEKGTDRVNCPFSYNMGTPVYTANQGSQSACYKPYTSSYNYYTSNYGYGYYSYSSYDSGSIAGIAVGVTLGFIILLTLIIVVSRRRNVTVRRHVAGVTVPVNNQYAYPHHGHNVVVTGPGMYPAPYPGQQYPQGVFPPPPPSYEVVGPYPGHPASNTPAGPGAPHPPAQPQPPRF